MSWAHAGRAAWIGPVVWYRIRSLPAGIISVFILSVMYELLYMPLIVVCICKVHHRTNSGQHWERANDGIQRLSCFLPPSGRSGRRITAFGQSGA